MLCLARRQRSTLPNARAPGPKGRVNRPSRAEHNLRRLVQTEATLLLKKEKRKRASQRPTSPRRATPVAPRPRPTLVDRLRDGWTVLCANLVRLKQAGIKVTKYKGTWRPAGPSGAWLSSHGYKRWHVTRIGITQFAARLEYMLDELGLTLYKPYCPYYLRAISALKRLTTSTLIPLKSGIGECLRHCAQHGVAPIRSDWYYAPEVHSVRVHELQSDDLQGQYYTLVRLSRDRQDKALSTPRGT